MTRRGNAAPRGKGVGQSLLKLAVGWLFELGHDRIRLTTGAGTRADRFYAAQGWTRELAGSADVGYALGKPGTITQAAPIRRPERIEHEWVPGQVPDSLTIFSRTILGFEAFLKQDWFSKHSMHITFRNYIPDDRPAVDQVVHDAWIELAPVTPRWDQLATRLGALTENAGHTEIVVAELNGDIVGAVGYVGPHRPKPDFFAPEWPMVRFLSVAPKGRGHGAGWALLDECIRRAERDDSELIALHTTPVMEAAQHLYRRAGFKVMRHLPDMYGVPYVLMTREL